MEPPVQQWLSALSQSPLWDACSAPACPEMVLGWLSHISPRVCRIAYLTATSGCVILVTHTPKGYMGISVLECSSSGERSALSSLRPETRPIDPCRMHLVMWREPDVIHTIDQSTGDSHSTRGGRALRVMSAMLGAQGVPNESHSANRSRRASIHRCQPMLWLPRLHSCLPQWCHSIGRVRSSDPSP
jgi:hypothetical protein